MKIDGKTYSADPSRMSDEDWNELMIRGGWGRSEPDVGVALTLATLAVIAVVALILIIR